MCLMLHEVSAGVGELASKSSWENDVWRKSWKSLGSGHTQCERFHSKVHAMPRDLGPPVTSNEDLPTETNMPEAERFWSLLWGQDALGWDPSCTDWAVARGVLLDFLSKFIETLLSSNFEEVKDTELFFYSFQGSSPLLIDLKWIFIIKLKQYW